MIKYFCDNCGVELKKEEMHIWVRQYRQKSPKLVPDGKVIRQEELKQNEKILCEKCSHKIWDAIGKEDNKD